MILPVAMIISSIGTCHDLQLPPILSYISNIAVSSTYIQDIAAAYTNSWSNAPNIPMIIYLSISCGFNIYLTAHIVCHMVQFAPRISTSRALCHRIAALFVQSALLYLIPTFVFIALCAQRSLGQNLLFPILCQLQVSLISGTRVLMMLGPRLISRRITHSLYRRCSSSCG